MKLIPYKAPNWFFEHSLVQKNLKHVTSNIPTSRVPLISQKPTPIQSLLQSSLPGYQLYLKRDDQTHTEIHLQGNKLRKLEFLFADALANRAEHILTAGGLQSNHCRTVAAVCAKLGLKSHLFLRSPHADPSKIEINGNLLVDVMLGSSIYLIEKGAQYFNAIEPKMKILAEKLSKDPHKSYLIPVGGSNLIGLWGYVEMFDEMMFTQKANSFCEDVCVTTGSGGTMSGLAIANFLTGSKFQLHAFCVCDSSDYFYSHLKDTLRELFGPSAEIPDPRTLVNIVQCSKGVLNFAK